MAYSTTFSAFVDQLLVEPGLVGSVDQRFGYKLTAATVTANTITTTDREIIRLGANYVDNRFQGWHLYLASAGEEAMVTNMSVSSNTATLNFIGLSATTSGTPTTVYLLRHCSWSELRNAVNDVLEYIPVECQIPLYHGPTDADMQDSDTVDASWTESNATDSLQTTAAEVWNGARSLVVTDSGSGGGYTASAVMRMGHSEQGTAYAIVKADTGTVALRVTDNGGNTVETVSTTQEDWVFIKKQFTLDSTDEGAALRLMGTTASAEGDWQFAWIVRHSSRIFRLPGWIDERFKVKGISRAYFRTPGDEADTWLADDVEFVALRGPEWDDQREWRPVFAQADANPHRIVLEDHCRLDEPLFLTIESNYALPYGVAAIFSGATSLLADAVTTTCPPHLLTARVKQWIGAMWQTEYAGLEARGVQEYASRLRSRETPQPKTPVRHIRMMSY